MPNDQHLQWVFENAPVGIVILDENEIWLHANPAMCAMLGKDREELIGHKYEAWIPDDSLETRERAREEFVRTGSWRGKFKMLRSAEDVLYLDLQATIFQNGHRLVLATDVTQQEKDREVLRISEERKAAILDSAIDCIITMDHEGRIVNFNPAAERTFGYCMEDVVGKTVADTIIPERLRKAHWNGFERYLRTGKQHVMDQLLELPAMRADGSEFPVEMSINAIRTNNAPPYFTAFLRDITKRKETEEALHEAGLRKDEFIATMAHELRNPLAPIRTALDILQNHGDEKALTSEMLVMMDRQLKHLVHLIEDLLDVSRIGQGKIELRKRIMDLNSVIYEAVESTRTMCDNMEHTVTLDLPMVPIEILADRTRIIQVLGNLLSNACKYTNKGGQISVKVERKGESAIIRIKDNGIGIAREELSRIFQMFGQVVNPLSNIHGGLGIGLSLVKTMVELHGGNVLVKSDGIGHGSEFIVHLPLNEGQHEAAIVTEDRTVRTSNSRPMRILVVDDNRDTVLSLSALLMLNGHEVFTAYDGREAVEVSDRHSPEVIIMDIGMPRLNGYEAARLIRDQNNGVRPRIVAITGWGQDVDRERAEYAGFDHHMVKPVDPEVLLTWLQDEHSNEVVSGLE